MVDFDGERSPNFITLFEPHELSKPKSPGELVFRTSRAALVKPLDLILWFPRLATVEHRSPSTARQSAPDHIRHQSISTTWIIEPINDIQAIKTFGLLLVSANVVEDAGSAGFKQRDKTSG